MTKASVTNIVNYNTHDELPAFFLSLKPCFGGAFNTCTVQLTKAQVSYLVQAKESNLHS